jgi:hypothetical protein
VLYVIGVAPQESFNQYEPAFEKVVASIQPAS